VLSHPAATWALMAAGGMVGTEIQHYLEKKALELGTKAVAGRFLTRYGLKIIPGVGIVVTAWEGAQAIDELNHRGEIMRFIQQLAAAVKLAERQESIAYRRIRNLRKQALHWAEEMAKYYKSASRPWDPSELEDAAREFAEACNDGKPCRIKIRLGPKNEYDSLTTASRSLEPIRILP